MKTYCKKDNNMLLYRKTKKEVYLLQYIGKLDVNKLGEYKDKIIITDVVLTEERIRHIRERHPRRL